MCLTVHSTSLLLLLVEYIPFSVIGAADGLKQATIVEPIDPFKRFPLECGHAFPWAKPVDDFCFVEAIYSFGQGVIHCPLSWLACKP